MGLLKSILIGSIYLSSTLAGYTQGTIKVDVEYALIVDTSGSIDDMELYLQREATRNAFKSPRIIRAIENNFNQTSAFSYYEFSTPCVRVINSFTIKNSKDIEQFITLFPEDYVRPADGKATHSIDCVERAYIELTTNNIESKQIVITLATDDTTDNKVSGRGQIQYVKNHAPKYVSINGLAIVPKTSQAYQRNIILDWLKDDVVFGSKASYDLFTYEMIEQYIVRAIEIEAF